MEHGGGGGVGGLGPFQTNLLPSALAWAARHAKQYSSTASTSSCISGPKFCSTEIRRREYMIIIHWGEGEGVKFKK